VEDLQYRTTGWVLPHLGVIISGIGCHDVTRRNPELRRI
jgi:hypothetical protein